MLELKKTKLSNEMYTEILEETLLQTRYLLLDAQAGLKTLREEYNWQVRNNQRFEKVITKIQEMTQFDRVLKGQVESEHELIQQLQVIAEYIESKINRTLHFQETRKVPNLL